MKNISKTLLRSWVTLDGNTIVNHKSTIW